MKKQFQSRAKKSAKSSPLKMQSHGAGAVKLQDGRPVKITNVPPLRQPARKTAQIKSKPVAQKKRKVIRSEVAEPDNSTREQLYNSGEIGTAKQISVPVAQITSLRGVMFDVDLKHFKKSPLMPTVPRSSKELYEKYVAGWLKNHPVLSKAEVRNSGNGLHVLLMLDKPIELQLDHERDYWECRVRLIQCALPNDSNGPGIDAKTRPVGVINEKNNATVSLLQKGQPVTKQELEELAAQVCVAPFRTLFLNLIGAERSDPCPVCRKPSTYLTALDEHGVCYGGKHKVSYEEFINTIMGE